MVSLGSVCWAAALAAFAGGCSPGWGAQASSEVIEGPQRLRIATFNADNFFDDDPANSGGKVTGERENTPSPQAYQGKLAQVAQVIQDTGADLVMLQEVETQRVLQDLARLLGDYPYQILVQGNDPRGINLGLLARLPPSEVRSHTREVFYGSQEACAGATGDSPCPRAYQFARDCLEVTFLVGSEQVVLFGVHFKSKIDGGEDKRRAEARYTRRLVEERLRADPELSVVVLGDFNSNPGEVPKAAVLGEPSVCSCEGEPFAAVSARLQPSEAWTRADSSGGAKELFDDLVLNGRMEGALLPESIFLVRPAPAPPGMDSVSDHSALVASFLVEPEGSD